MIKLARPSNQWAVPQSAYSGEPAKVHVTALPEVRSVAPASNSDLTSVLEPICNGLPLEMEPSTKMGTRRRESIQLQDGSILPSSLERTFYPDPALAAMHS